MEEMVISGVRCIVKYPKSFSTDQKYPLLFFFHGAGTRGDDIHNLINHPFFTLTAAHEALPFVIVAPFCTENTWFDMWERLKHVVKMATDLPFVDRSRVYIMGASMGGYATWQMAMSLPEYFSAIVPICGGGMYWNAARLVNIPAWAFHGAKDSVVRLEESRKMVDEINRCGGNAKLTVYPENGHDAWSDTFTNIAVFDWLLQHRSSNWRVCDDE